MSLSHVLKSVRRVIAVALAFTIYAIVRLVGMIVSGHAGWLRVGVAAVVALQGLVILVAVLSVARMLYRRQSRSRSAPRP